VCGSERCIVRLGLVSRRTDAASWWWVNFTIVIVRCEEGNKLLHAVTQSLASLCRLPPTIPTCPATTAARDNRAHS